MASYRFQTAAGGHWDLHSADTDAYFYDIYKNTLGKMARWHLRIGASVDIPVTEHLSIELSTRRVTVAGTADVYALRFPSRATLQLFETEYRHKMLENTYELEYDSIFKDQAIQHTAQSMLQLACCICFCLLQYYLLK